MKSQIKRVFLSLLGFLLLTVASSADSHSEDALKQLSAGNLRFTQNHLLHPHQTKERRDEVAKGQHPTVAVLSCADSRVPPEMIFDEGLGDVFTVRVAGNVVDDDVLGSLEYAVEHLHVTTIVVLGHTECGAVKAAIAGKLTHTHIDSLIDAIAPAVEKVRNAEGILARNCERANVRQSIQAITDDPYILSEAVHAHKINVVGAVYNLKTGKVDWL